MSRTVVTQYWVPVRRGCARSRGVSDWLHVRPELDLRVALTPGGCQIGDMDYAGCHQMVF
jgi:hypothetical protein